MKELNDLKECFDKEALHIKSLKELNDLRINYLGKKSKIQELTNNMRELSIEEKKEYGRVINDLKSYVESTLNNLKTVYENTELNKQLEEEEIDVTLPSTNIPTGTVHPITKIVNEIEDLFISMGYDV